jgi:prostaglandin-E synthase
MTETVNTAPIKWAQRSDFLYVTIVLHGVSKESVIFNETEMHFKGTTQKDGKYYEANIEFYKPIVPEESVYIVHPLSVEMIVKKSKEKSGSDEGFWPHLLKDKSLERNEVTIDWNHYVDEDGEDSDSGHPFPWLD